MAIQPKEKGRKSASRGRKPAGETAATVEQMYNISGHWLSDIRFFADELNFFRLLIDKNLMWLTDDNHIDDTRKMVSDLKYLDAEGKRLEGRLKVHFGHLEELVENPFAHDEFSCREEQRELGEMIFDYMKKFRQTKKTVFRHAEEVLETEKASHLLTP